MSQARRRSPPDPSSELFAQIAVRWTRGRRSIVEVLTAAPRPLAASDLLRLLPRTSTSTLYRDLALLEQEGAIERLLGSGAVAHFELRRGAGL